MPPLQPVAQVIEQAARKGSRHTQQDKHRAETSDKRYGVAESQPAVTGHLPRCAPAKVPY